jgi:selenocysteine-specific elongation factor
MKPMNQKNITLGTAGHIDHGKTALVRNLTGCETDRLKEEKERGMSIELGFAPWKIADIEVGIVDVPGHENFIKTMVAGATGIDAAIFVIAADDGVMPQTREHLDILSLLGVQRGVVVLTKVDMVLPERVDAVTREVRSFLRGTFLQDAPIFPFSNITGQGFEEFYEGLGNLVQSLTPKQTDGIFRLPVERTFSVKGYGTIVSGIPVSGSAGLGDQVIVYPQAVVGRIKAIQVYQTQSERVQCGQCAAINVTQWDHDKIARGDVITVESWFAPSNWYLCALDVLALEGLYLKNGSSVKFHTGTSESTAVVYMMEGDRALSGEQVLVQVQLNQPIVAAPLDRFIMRSLSPVQTIGGGTIVEALEQKLRRSRPEVVEDARRRAAAVRDDAAFAEYVIQSAHKQALTIKAVAQRIKKTLPYTEKVVQTLANTGAVLTIDQGLLIHNQNLNLFKQQTLDRLIQYHKTDPASPGMDMDTCQTECTWPKPVFHRVLKELENEGKIRLMEGRVCVAGHSAVLDSAGQKRMQEVEALFLQRLFRPPEQKEITELCRLSTKEVEDTLRLLTEHGRLVRVARDIFFHAEAVAKARQAVVNHLKREKRLESVQFKYLIDATRKYALPLLDYFDRIGITKRSPDNTRYLGPKA